MAVKKGNELTKWDEEFAKHAQKSAEQEKATGFKSINIKNAHMYVDDTPVEGNELDVVVIGSIFENQYFEGAYDPNKTQIPVCYAFGDPNADDPEANMKPHPQAKDPQHDNCAECPHNQWNSADQGKGKACKNVRRLAVILADDAKKVETIEKAETRALKVSVTSVKNWAKYLKEKLAEISRPHWSVITNVKVVPDPKSQHKIVFGFKSAISDSKLFPTLKHKNEVTNKELQTPYPEPEEEAPKAKGKAKKRKI